MSHSAAGYFEIMGNQTNCPSWPGGVARSAGVVDQSNFDHIFMELERPPRLRLRRSHPSLICQLCYLNQEGSCATLLQNLKLMIVPWSEAPFNSLLALQ
jgi:hypothetical protein